MFLSRGRITAALGMLGLAATLLGGVAQQRALAQSRAASSIALNGAGSTFIYPLMSHWALVYGHQVNKNVSVNYQPVGSGAGIASFTKGLVDFAASDAFLSPAQMTAAGGDVLHLPLTLGPVAITYNLPQVTVPLKLDGPTLANIYLGKITTWSDAAIAALNKGVKLPSTPIVVAHRADGSGTTFIFTHYLAAVSSAWNAGPGAATVVSWPVGTGGRGSAGVAATVKQSPGGIGYVELSYAKTNNLPVAAIKNAQGNFELPTIAGAAADAANAAKLPDDLRAIIVNSRGASSYPISGFSWGLIHQHAPNNDKYGALLTFLWWCIHDGQQYADAGGLYYAPLPASIVKADEAKIMSVTYNGKPLFTGH